jgi:hypothetical protein
MKSFIAKAVTEPLQGLFQKAAEYLPTVLTGLVVLLLGLLLAWVVKLLAVRFIRLLKLEGAFLRSGVTDALQKMAVKDTPAKLIGRMLYWLVVVIFFILSLSVMKIPVIDELLGRFLLYLPNIFVALVIMSIGVFFGNFLGRAALIASVNAGIRLSGILSKSVRTVILMFAAVMALEQLGIARSTVIATFTIVFGGIVLALALAFGLGGRGLAAEFLEKRFKKEVTGPGEDKEDELRHL